MCVRKRERVYTLFIVRYAGPLLPPLGWDRLACLPHTTMVGPFITMCLKLWALWCLAASALHFIVGTIRLWQPSHSSGVIARFTLD